ncbi:uncharacterized protein LOC133913134 [Phragmites australis]|uniref:uncharacterized protein LOC133913134 n=1 Tax=Phragmites australis TaxID=29695 RepID=UPI002D773AA0|nr:uncharacterized protein LOC133913134 [Phragmites australis]
MRNRWHGAAGLGRPPWRSRSSSMAGSSRSSFPGACSGFLGAISDYKLALEGPVAYLDHYGVADPLSCKAVFQQLSYRKRVHHLNIYVIVCWRELNQIGPSLHIPLHINHSTRSFHMLKLSHIFPANNNALKEAFEVFCNKGVWQFKC